MAPAKQPEPGCGLRHLLCAPARGLARAVSKSRPYSPHDEALAGSQCQLAWLFGELSLHVYLAEEYTWRSAQTPPELGLTAADPAQFSLSARHTLGLLAEDGLLGPLSGLQLLDAAYDWPAPRLDVAPAAAERAEVALAFPWLSTQARTPAATWHPPVPA